MSTFLQVVEDEGEQPISVPVEEDGTLLLSTLASQFPTVSGLRFRMPGSSGMCGVRVSDSRLYPPHCGWGNHIYHCVFPKAESKRKSDDYLENSTAESKRFKPTTSQCSDLVVLGLPWEFTEQQLREHFTSFGQVVMTEVKKDVKTGRSKGFGFIRFANYDSQHAVLSQQHFIEGRCCNVRIPFRQQAGMMMALPRFSEASNFGHGKAPVQSGGSEGSDSDGFMESAGGGQGHSNPKPPQEQLLPSGSRDQPKRLEISPAHHTNTKEDALQQPQCCPICHYPFRLIRALKKHIYNCGLTHEVPWRKVWRNGRMEYETYGGTYDKPHLRLQPEIDSTTVEDSRKCFQQSNTSITEVSVAPSPVQTEAVLPETGSPRNEEEIETLDTSDNGTVPTTSVSALSEQNDSENNGQNSQNLEQKLVEDEDLSRADRVLHQDVACSTVQEEEDDLLGGVLVMFPLTRCTLPLASAVYPILAHAVGSEACDVASENGNQEKAAIDTDPPSNTIVEKDVEQTASEHDTYERLSPQFSTKGNKRGIHVKGKMTFRKYSKRYRAPVVCYLCRSAILPLAN